MSVDFIKMFLSAAHCEVSRWHAAATVPGYVSRERGQRGDLPDRHEEHVQPQTGGAQEVRPEGEVQRCSQDILQR